MRHQDRLDLPGFVLFQPRFDFGRTHRPVPLSFEGFHLGPEERCGIAPAHRKPPALQHQNFVPLGEDIGERRLPGAVAIGNVDVRASLGSEQPADVGQQAVGERQKRAAIDVDRRPVHRAQHLVWDGGGAWDGQKLAPRSHNHFALGRSLGELRS